MFSSEKCALLELRKFPHPYQAAFTVGSDIDSANIARFRGIHALFCGNQLLPENSPAWRALGLTRQSPGFAPESGGVQGLGLNFADSFFLIRDETTFGLHRFDPSGRFVDDTDEGVNCADQVRAWIREGSIDSFHTFLHYTRAQVAPLLKDFYRWCEAEHAPKPSVWLNHALSVSPSGICPAAEHIGSMHLLARVGFGNLVRSVLGRQSRPLRSAFARYDGANPRSPHYINDIVSANGLRFVWLNMADLYQDRIALKEQKINGRWSILSPIKMDDGISYYRFSRCFGTPSGTARGGGAYLTDSEQGFDSSHLISESSLEELCRCRGTCILYTHWTHGRSMPIRNGTIARFSLLRQWRDAGKIWVTSLSNLLEWTRRRTFLNYNCRREDQKMILDIVSVDDPVFGRETVDVRKLNGLAFTLPEGEFPVVVVVGGQVLPESQIGRSGRFLWLEAGKDKRNGHHLPHLSTERPLNLKNV